MGYYINPPDRSKEDWLRAYGKPISTPEVEEHDWSSDALPVCLVGNGAFTVAGIAYERQEAEAFNGKGDQRPKQWYLVSKVALEPFYKERV